MIRSIRLLLIASIIGMCTSISYGQIWFDVGLKGSWGTSFMINTNIFDDDRIDHRLSPAYSYGASVGVHFDKRNGLVVEYLRSRSNQYFDDERAGIDLTEDVRQSWITNDVGLYFKHSGYGVYVEIGPKIGFVSDAFVRIDDGEELDMTENVSKNLYSGVLGFGTYLLGSDAFTLQLGIRLQYQFNDLAEDGESSLYPVFEDYADYKSTNPVHAQLMLEFNYAIGRFAKESCRDRWKLILFQ